MKILQGKKTKFKLRRTPFLERELIHHSFVKLLSGDSAEKTLLQFSDLAAHVNALEAKHEALNESY